jgi:hypothetical protein
MRPTPNLIGSPSQHRGSFETRVTVSRGRAPGPRRSGPLPGQDHLYPFGIIGVAPRYIPAGAVIELAGIRLTRRPQVYKRNTGGGNRIRGHLSRGPKLRTFPSKVTRGLHPTPPMEPMMAPRGECPLCCSLGVVFVALCMCVCVCVCVRMRA